MKNDKIRNKIVEQSVSDNSWMDEILEDDSKIHYLHHSSAIATEILLELKRRKMSQTDLAHKLDVSPQYINKIVKGKENLTLDTIGKIEKELEMNLIQVPTSEKNLFPLDLGPSSLGVMYSDMVKIYANFISYSQYQKFDNLLESKDVFETSFKFNYNKKFKKDIVMTAPENFEILQDVKMNFVQNFGGRIQSDDEKEIKDFESLESLYYCV